MIKTYRLVHARLPADLAELVCDYIKPTSINLCKIVESGCVELIEMMNSEECARAYEDVLSDHRFDIASYISSLRAASWRSGWAISTMHHAAEELLGHGLYEDNPDMVRRAIIEGGFEPDDRWVEWLEAHNPTQEMRDAVSEALRVVRG